MKFAIYGDSFATASPPHKPDPLLNSLAWTTLLAQRMGATSIDYHARSGTSFFYSYQKILNTALDYDRIIVAVTQPTRYTKEINGYHFVSPLQISQANEFGIDYQTVLKLNAWFAMSDIDFMTTAQELMISNIESRWPNAVIVPSFPQSFMTARAARWHNFGLCDINSLMRQQLGLEEMYSKNEILSTTGLLCHMPVEWHGAVADLIYNFLQTGSIVIPPLVLSRGLDSYYNISS